MSSAREILKKIKTGNQLLNCHFGRLQPYLLWFLQELVSGKMCYVLCVWKWLWLTSRNITKLYSRLAAILVSFYIMGVWDIINFLIRLPPYVYVKSCYIDFISKELEYKFIFNSIPRWSHLNLKALSNLWKLNISGSDFPFLTWKRRFYVSSFGKLFFYAEKVHDSYRPITYKKMYFLFFLIGLQTLITLKKLSLF